MKRILLIAFVSLNISCKDETAANLEAMKKEFESYLKDDSFKRNEKLEIFQLDAISYDTLSENYIDTLRLFSIDKKFEHFKEASERAGELVKTQMGLVKVYSSIGSKAVLDMTKKDVEESLKKLDRFNDSLRYYYLQDSLVKKQIEARENPKNVYAANFFIKASFSKGNETSNILDTVHIYFDEKLKIIPLP